MLLGRNGGFKYPSAEMEEIKVFGIFKQKYKLADLDKNWKTGSFVPFELNGKKRVNILAMGDVGGMLATGLKLMGADTIEAIGIYDTNENVALRYEAELNQIAYPLDSEPLPVVRVLSRKELFDCDVFVFCASKGVPQVGDAVDDVRMAQFEANKSIAEEYAVMAADEGFKGMFAVVSDPVDPLCKAVYLAGKGKLLPEQLRGFGLGVMNSRALYYARNSHKYQSYINDGRAFGPHGEDLVIANSLKNYDDSISKELTQLTVGANIRVREMGFKPYIAPALSSGAISLLLALRGQWHYSSNFIGSGEEGAFMGALNRITEAGIELENTELPKKLFKRIKGAYEGLKQII